MGTMKDITVLILGNLHQHAAARTEAAFRAIRIETGDPALVTSEMARDVRGVAVGMKHVDADFIDALPNLEIMASFGVGYDKVDAAYAGKKGVMVTNTPDVLT
ncbi:2-hydroxyacid dehydrogenase, partial [Rhizobiaceae sp. 2RAB30]